MDERPAIEQVKSGLKIVGAILSSFAAFLLFAIGYVDITRPEWQHIALGWLLLMTTVAAMFVTVHFWADGSADSLVISLCAARCSYSSEEKACHSGAPSV